MLIYVLNSNYLEITGLKDISTTPPTYLSDAVLLGTLYNSSNNPVSGFTDVVGVYQTNSNGVYRFFVTSPSTFNPPLGIYKLVVDGDEGINHFHLIIPKVRVVERNNVI